MTGRESVSLRMLFGSAAATLWVAGAMTGCGGSGVGTDSSGIAAESASETVHLTAAEVTTIINQAATQAMASGLPVTIAVVDHQGVVLGVQKMAGARDDITLTGGGTGGLDGVPLVVGSFSGIPGATPAVDAAISKAGTGAFFSTQGNAFTTRTASFIVQEHFPPQVNPSPGGPLFGVQFSNLRCSDLNRGAGVPQTSAASNLPLGLSADPGGLPLYKNGVAVGGIGVEGDGIYTLDQGQPDTTPTVEEVIAAAGTLGFSAPKSIRGDNIFVDGIRLVFANAEPPATQTTIAAGGTTIVAPMDSPVTGFNGLTLNGVTGTVSPLFAGGFVAGTTPPPAGGGLTVADVTRIIGQAAVQANVTRAAIRLPIGSPARVTISVVDAVGNVLGMFRTLDAPIFGFDVSAQKARTAAFFSSAAAAAELNAAALGAYVTAANADGLGLDGSVAYSSRAVGFLSQPIYPPGAIAPFANGPFSKPLGQWSIFNTGLQLDLINPLTIGNLGNLGAGCDPNAITNPKLNNGITIFPGGFPLYKNGVLVGAIGISGDGVDQDDLISFAGSAGFEAPAGIRSDTVTVRGAALPYVVIPRHPNL
jgi:uncharacterized protein GlcG (DUF336 family)